MVALRVASSAENLVAWKGKKKADSTAGKMADRKAAWRGRSLAVRTAVCLVYPTAAWTVAKMVDLWVAYLAGSLAVTMADLTAAS